MIINVLDRPIAYHRILAKVAGSVNGGVFLSQAVYWSGRTTLDGGWFYKTTEDWTEETCLTRREIDTVRKRLKTLGILEEALHGVPAKLHYRLNSQSLNRHIQIQSDTLGNVDVQASLALSAKLDVAKAPNLIAQNRQTITENTTETTPKITNISSGGDFHEFWAEYPRRPGDSKKKAEEKYRAAIKRKAKHEDIMAGVRAYAATRAGQDPIYTAMAATWLNQERWLSDYGPTADPSDIEAFCQKYPTQNVGSRELIKHYFNLGLQSATVEEIMGGLEKYCVLLKQKKGEGYPLQLPAPSAWLQMQKWREMDNYEIAFRGMGEKYLRIKKGSSNA